MKGFKIHYSYEPVCLYTYETCSARKIIVQFDCVDDTYEYMLLLIQKHFGNRMDNKVTVKFMNSNKEVLYMTYWDGKITIGTNVHFWADITESTNSYRVVLPI